MAASTDFFSTLRKKVEDDITTMKKYTRITNERYVVPMAATSLYFDSGADYYLDKHEPNYPLYTLTFKLDSDIIVRMAVKLVKSEYGNYVPAKEASLVEAYKLLDKELRTKKDPEGEDFLSIESIKATLFYNYPSKVNTILDVERYVIALIKEAKDTYGEVIRQTLLEASQELARKKMSLKYSGLQVNQQNPAFDKQEQDKPMLQAFGAAAAGSGAAIAAPNAATANPQQIAKPTKPK